MLVQAFVKSEKLALNHVSYRKEECAMIVKIFYSGCFYSWFYVLATDKPVINQCKPHTPTLFLLCTEVGYFLLPAPLCAENCTGNFPVLKKDFEMKMLPHFRS